MTSAITPEHKAVYRKARLAAHDAVAKLNAIFVETGRTYRAALCIEHDPVTDDDRDPFQPQWDDDEPDDGDQRSSIGRERAEHEDESGGL
jgi:hypothetical protein